MQLLITGATGFVGRNLLIRVLDAGTYDKIWIPVRNVQKFKEQMKVDGFATMPPSVHAFTSSTDDWKLDDAAAADHVVHCAGVIFARTWQGYADVNVEGSVRLLEALKNPSKVILLSSQSATGPCADLEQTKTEKDPDFPITWYGKSKLEMEKVVDRKFPNLPKVYLRPPMIFGARDHATLPLFRMAKKSVLFKPGFKNKVYSFISVDDLVSAIVSTLDPKSNWSALTQNRFYVCSTRTITDRELLTSAASVCGRKGHVVSIPQGVLKLASRLVDTIPTWRATIPSLSVDRAKEIWPWRWATSPAAFQKNFNWSPKDDLLPTLHATRDWYVRSGQLT